MFNRDACKLLAYLLWLDHTHARTVIVNLEVLQLCVGRPLRWDSLHKVDERSNFHMIFTAVRCLKCSEIYIDKKGAKCTLDATTIVFSVYFCLR